LFSRENGFAGEKDFRRFAGLGLPRSSGEYFWVDPDEKNKDRAIELSIEEKPKEEQIDGLSDDDLTFHGSYWL